MTRGKLLDIVTQLHRRTKRDYLGRMNEAKVECMGVAKRYGRDYWDGERRYGYGGYRYDGRWEVVARALVEAYRLSGDVSILDVGCGKGYLLYELSKLLPQARLAGFDISAHALENAKPEIRQNLFLHRAEKPFPFEDGEFSLVVSLTTLHNLEVFDVVEALGEMERVATNKYLVVESFRDDGELFNLQCWALTCQAFLSPRAWEWVFERAQYTGDYEFIYFE